MNYIKAALVIVLGIAVYYVALVTYNEGAANFFGLVYVLLSIRVYQLLDVVWPQSNSVAA